MNLSFAKYLILFLLFASCFENGRNIKKYGYLKNEEVSLNVPLKLSEFKEFGVFIDRLNEIVCNDSVPKIVIQNKNIYPVEDCNPKPFNPKGKHFIMGNHINIDLKKKLIWTH